MPRLRFLRPSTGLGLEKRGIHPPIWPFIGRFYYLRLFAWLLPALISASLNIQSLSGRIFTLRRLAKTIRSDLFAVDESLSETVVYEKINLENRTQALIGLKEKVNIRIAEIQKLSDDWEKHLAEKKSIPKSNFTQSDKEKVDTLEKNFKNYLRCFNYQSVSSYDSIQISRENYLPISEGFDMKFDSSASDNIRAIWSYTLALLKTSNEKNGNHPQIVIFDEPGQHSIVTNDMVIFS